LRAFEDFEVTGVAALDEAGPGEISFLSNPKYRAQVLKTCASAVLVAEAVPETDVLQLKTPNPYLMLGRLMQTLYPEPVFEPGIHPTAVVSPNARLDPTAHVGPGCHVAAGVVIGEGSVLLDHVSVGRNASMGAHCRIFPHVTIYDRCRLGSHVRVHANTVVGSDGFGYAQDHGRHIKMPQIAAVVIEDHVEIGSNCSIDRGSLKDTVIGEGTKIDNLVQIAHGVQIGPDSMIIAQCGISGSAKLGRGVILAGQTGVTGHVELADHVVVMGKSVVTKSIRTPGQYAGNPAIQHMRYQRQLASLRLIDKIRARLTRLEKKVEETHRD